MNQSLFGYPRTQRVLEYRYGQDSSNAIAPEVPVVARVGQAVPFEFALSTGVGSVAANMRMYVNGDTNAAFYAYQGIALNAGAVTASSGGDLFIAALDAANALIVGQGLIQITPFGINIQTSHFRRQVGVSNGAAMYWVYYNPLLAATFLSLDISLSKLTLQPSAGGIVGAGSYFKFYLPNDDNGGLGS